jgi:endonuclease YncB( thermonuclease family)
MKSGFTTRLILFLLLSAPAMADVTGKVVSVTDGDTIKVLDASNTQHKIRLTGIDAPERDQPYGNASRKHLASLVAGKEVFVESDKNDRYGRVLCKVWVQPSDCPTCGKTLDANHAQLLAGMAWWYRYYSKEQSPEDRGRYESAEDEAKARKWGLWADPTPGVPPALALGVPPLQVLIIWTNGGVLLRLGTGFCSSIEGDHKGISRD